MRASSRIAAIGLLVLSLVLAFGAAPAEGRGLDNKEWKAAEKDLKKALALNDHAGIDSALQVLATDQSKRAVKLLLAVGLKLDDSKIFDSAKRALGSMTEPEAVEEMIKNLRKKDWRIRVLLVECLADVPGAEVTEAIGKRAAEDDVTYVVSAAAKALGKRGGKEAIGPLIDALERLEKTKDVAWRNVRQALTGITGYDFETAADWRNFWEPRKETFDPETAKGDKADASTVERDNPKFFGSEIVSKRILFVIDISGSMAAEDPGIQTDGGGGGGKRIERAKAELIKVVKALTPKHKFNIIAFSDGIRSWQKAKIVPATPNFQADAVKWVSALQPTGLTRTDKALEEAFKNNEINTIFVLSDGAPQKDMNPFTPAEIEGILEQVRVANKFRHVRVETFGFEAVAQAAGGNVFVDFLKKLAEENEGQFHGI